jgi:chorismate mutase/prephenate dehydrogenase
MKRLSEFSERFNQALSYVEKGDKGAFIKQFFQVGGWFGDYSKQCLLNSKKLLLKADDDRSF